MLCSTARVIIQRSNPSFVRRFSSILKTTHFNSVSSPSISPIFQPIQTVSPLSFKLFGLRLDHTMAGQSSKPQSIYDFTVKDGSVQASLGAPRLNITRYPVTLSTKDAKGKDVDLSIYKGKVLIIVNVASQCGLTNSNYTDMTELYRKYKDQGLEILAFPCNQFGGQEPGSIEDIQTMVCTRFKAEYPIFDKVDVNGDNAAPLYKFLKSSKGGFFGDSIKWNFSKFLIDKEGNVFDRYSPTTSPASMEKDIKKLLGVA